VHNEEGKMQKELAVA